MKKIGFFKKLKIFFLSKRKTIDYLIKVNSLLESRMNVWVNHIEALDQQKLYVLEMPGADSEAVANVYAVLNEVKSRMRWSSPEIVVINQRLVCLGGDDLSELIARLKKIVGE